MSILNKFQAFSMSRLSDAANVLAVMRRNNISPEAFQAAVAEAVEAQRKQVRADAEKTAAASEKRLQNRTGKAKGSARQYPKTLGCPECGQPAYAQPVCPSCKKGRAGIRREYICGECNFVFYLD